MRLRVASYNIRKAIGTDRLRRPERIAAVLAELNADIVVLQEADRRVGARASALPPALIDAMDYVVAPLALRVASVGWHGNAILVRRGLALGAAQRLALPTIEPRGAVAAEVAGVRIVGMHLDLSGIRRRQQAHCIVATLERMAPMPTLIMGDTNEWRAHGGCIADFARSFTLAATGPSYHARRPVAALDRIFVGHGARTIAAGTHHSPLATRASDHLPVWADVEISPSTVPTRV